MNLGVSVLWCVCLLVAPQLCAASRCVLSISGVDGVYMQCAPAAIGPPLPAYRSAGEYALVEASPRLACEPLTNDLGPDTALLIDRGECAFSDKLLNAQKAGAAAVIFALNETFAFTVHGNSSEEITIPSLSIGSGSAKAIREALAEDSSLSVSFYLASDVDWFTIVVMLFASTGLVVAGSFWSARGARKSYIARGASPARSPEPVPEDVTEVSQSAAVAFVFMASIMLFLMYKFMSILIWFIFVVFVIGGSTSLMDLLNVFLKTVFAKGGCRQQHFSLGSWGSLSLTNLLAIPPSITVGVLWVVYRGEFHAWILQDLLACALLMTFFKTVRIPNMKVATILLSMALVYDVFWVFLSPLFTADHKSVMVEVATGAGTQEQVPVLIRVPRFDGAFAMLGLGDIVLPGLFISYLLRFDYESGFERWTRGYFMWGTIGYFVGMMCTEASMVIMEKGQPALLYLAPAVLASVFCKAVVTNASDFRRLWEGDEARHRRNSDDASSQAFLPRRQNSGGVAFPKYSPKDIWIENATGTTSKSV